MALPIAVHVYCMNSTGKPLGGGQHDPAAAGRWAYIHLKLDAGQEIAAVHAEAIKVLNGGKADTDVAGLKVRMDLITWQLLEVRVLIKLLFKGRVQTSRMELRVKTRRYGVQFNWVRERINLMLKMIEISSRTARKKKNASSLFLRNWQVERQCR